MSERVKISYEEAVAMLPDGDTVHTQLNPGYGFMVGAEWPREDVLELLQSRAGHIELTGPIATAMGHGMCVWQKDGDDRPVFIETK